MLSRFSKLPSLRFFNLSYIRVFVLRIYRLCYLCSFAQTSSHLNNSPFTVLPPIRSSILPFLRSSFISFFQNYFASILHSCSSPSLRVSALQRLWFFVLSFICCFISTTFYLLSHCLQRLVVHLIICISRLSSFPSSAITSLHSSATPSFRPFVFIRFRLSALPSLHPIVHSSFHVSVFPLFRLSTRSSFRHFTFLPLRLIAQKCFWKFKKKNF